MSPRLQILQPELDERSHLFLETGLARDLQCLEVRLARFLRINALFEPVVSGYKELLDTLSRPRSCGVLSHSSAGMLTFSSLYVGKKAKRIRVLIADDHTLFAAAVEAILGGDERFEVVGLARDGNDAIAQVLEKSPDVVLMDIAMPVLDGLEATRRLRTEAPNLPVIILTGSNAPTDVDRARRSGAAAYVTKDRIAGELIDAILECVNE